MKDIQSRMIYGNVPPRIDALFANTLDKEEIVVKKKSLALILLAAILILALACTAFALSIQYSARQQARNEAVDAVVEKYGLTNEMIGFFYAVFTVVDDGTEVAFKPMQYQEQVGMYTVLLQDGKAPAVSWTHDGNTLDADKMRAGDLDSRVWGPLQMEKIVELDKRRGEVMHENYEKYGDYLEWSLEDKAAIDQALADAGLLLEGVPRNVLPGDGDMQPDEAVSLAKRAAMDKYGFSEAYIEAFFPRLTYLHDEKTGEYTYEVELDNSRESDEGPRIYNMVMVQIDAVSRTVTRCALYADKRAIVFPEGPLDNYREAMEELMTFSPPNQSAFALLPAAEKAELAGRMEEAGLAHLLRGIRYVAPRGALKTEEEAVKVANAALFETFRVPAEALPALFNREALFYETPFGDTYWEVAYAPRDDIYYVIHMNRIGSYSVTINGETGVAQKPVWSESATKLPEVTASNWGALPAWPGEVLPYLLELRARLKPLNDLMRTSTSPLTLEQQAEIGRLHREAGFVGDRTEITAALPEGDDLTQEEAHQLIRQAIQAEYGFTEAEIDMYHVNFQFNMLPGGRREWSIDLYAGDYRPDYFMTTIDAKTGEILRLEYYTQSNG